MRQLASRRPRFSPAPRRLNSGQMLIRDHALVEAVLAAKPPTFGNNTPLEQWIAASTVHAAGFAAASLPHNFAGHCWYHQARISMCDLTTYHAHCLVTQREKLQRMRAVVAEAKGCDLTRPAGVDRECKSGGSFANCFKP